MKPPALSEKDKARYLAATQQKGSVWGQQTLQWVRSAYLHALEVATKGQEASAAVTGMFWIRVCGVFTDIRPAIAKHVESLSTMGAGPEQPESITSQLRGLAQLCLERIDAVKAALTEDELVYLEYRRHVEAHPWQNSYELRLGKNGIIDTKEVFGERKSVDELNVLIRRLLLKYGVNEDAIAVELARRVVPLLSATHEAFQRYCAPVI